MGSLSGLLSVMKIAATLILRRLLNAGYWTQNVSSTKNSQASQQTKLTSSSPSFAKAKFCSGRWISDLEATQIFELQNDRGKRLTDLEALKSFLMHGIYLHAGSNAESDLNILQTNFAAIYRAAEKMEAFYDSRHEDELLSDHCIAFER